MATPTKLPELKTVKHPRYSFAVVYHDERGRRQRNYFSSRKEAEARLAKVSAMIRVEGAVGMAMDAQDRAEFFAAKRLLSDAGAKVSIHHAVSVYLRDHPPGKKDELFTDAMESFLGEKSRVRRSERTVDTLRSRLSGFAASAGLIQCSDVTQAEIERYVFRRGVSARTTINDLTAIRAWCRWAAKPRNGYLAGDPSSDIERPTPPASAPVALTTDEALRCLSFADTQAPRVRLYAYVAILAGLRQSETLALTEQMLSGAASTGILAVVGIGKRGRSRRQVPICGRLRNVIADTLPHLPKFSQKPFAAMRGASGAADKWCPDILRHTWVSHRLALTGDAARTALEGGHDQATMAGYYVDPRTEADAKRLFGER